MIAIEKTPSLKATMRENSISFPSRCFAAASLLTAGSSNPGATEPQADPFHRALLECSPPPA